MAHLFLKYYFKSFTYKFKALFLCCLLISFWGNTQNIERIFIEGGTVKYNNVDIESFYISKYEITNSNYVNFLNKSNVSSNGVYKNVSIINITSEDLQIEFINNKWQPKLGKEKHPMVMVNYYGALAFCEWANGTLPTEIEWYYAASGGKIGNNFIYAGSDNLNEVGWYHDNSNGKSHEVGLKKPNELGIYDMSGNAWEWCLNDTLKSDKDFCLHMGGSWFAQKQPSSILAHYGNTPDHFSNSVGFRIIYRKD